MVVNVFSEQVQSRAAQRDQTRVRVLASAERLFRARGVVATTIRQIADDAGVSVGTVMAVGDKSALVVSIVDGWIAALHAVEHPGAEALTASGEVQSRIVDAVRPFLELFAANAEIAREYIGILVTGRHDSELFERLAETLVAEFENILRSAAAMQGGGSSDADSVGGGSASAGVGAFGADAVESDTTNADLESVDVAVDASVGAGITDKDPDETPAAQARTIYFAYLGILFAWASSGSTQLQYPLERLATVVQGIVPAQKCSGRSSQSTQPAQSGQSGESIQPGQSLQPGQSAQSGESNNVGQGNHAGRADHAGQPHYPTGSAQ